MTWPLSHRRSSDDFAEEIQAHLLLEIDRLVRSGMPREVATYEARKAFGNVAQAREHFQEHRPQASLERGWERLVAAMKTLRRSPGFCITAVLTLGLGVGASTAIFTLLYSAALRPLPVRDAERLVNVYEQFSGRFAREVEGFGSQISYIEFLNYERAHHSLVSAAVYATTDFASSASLDGSLRGAYVSCAYFPTLETSIAAGRAFAAEECAPAGARVAVISHRLWQSQFAGDSRVIGRLVDLNREPLTVVGVAERGFQGIDVQSVDVWVPATLEPVLRHGTDSLLTRDASWMTMVARLAPNVSVEQARADLAGMARVRDREFPGRSTRVIVRPAAYFNFPEAYQQGAPIAALLVALGCVLIAVACANIMSLLLARAITRRREIGIRLALGASRSRLVEQFVLEGLVLATMGGAVGAALSFLLGVVAKLLPITGLQIDLTPNVRVLAFSVLLSGAAAVLFAVLPALDATRLDVASAFKGLVTRGPRQVRPSWLRGAAVGVQVAAGALLLSLAADVARSAARSAGADLGFATKNVTAFQLNLSQLGYDGGRAATVYHAVTARLSQTPGVQAIGLASQLPLVGRNVETIEVRDSATGLWARARQSGVTYATRGYLNALGVRLVRGGTTDDSTVAQSTDGTAVVSSALASALWPNREGLGRRIRVGQRDYDVTAIAADARLVSPTNEHEGFAYLSPPASSVDLAIIVRTRAPIAGLEQTVRRAARELDPNILVHPDPFDERVSTVLRPARLTAVAAGTAGAWALVLALVGIYGTVSYAVRQRAHEISVRLALGATRGRVVGLVLLGGSRPVLTGVAVGGALAAGGGVLLRSVLAAVGTSEPLILLAAMLASLIVCYAAMLLPAAWAARLDPARTLRAD